MSCEGCISSAAAQSEQYTETLKRAREYAQQHNKQVAIYKEAFSFAFIEADIAIRDGYPIAEFVTRFAPANTG